jgi:hypothetical protein
MLLKDRNLRSIDLYQKTYLKISWDSIPLNFYSIRGHCSVWRSRTPDRVRGTRTIQMFFISKNESAYLKGQSHEKVGEVRVEGDSLGPN